ncbi:hypothetical protein EV356DRAFT_532277 [Viridothelium virens]|uniref:U6 snRNA phosphodiesterase 1 n=1 Tax=Viridothelium virens TaxID=1048519 RepID=A0A6A6HA85_VIRVR|nr:hypothetical protein EV356DRAFT_532277 [Viridothelium virens]
MQLVDYSDSESDHYDDTSQVQQEDEAGAGVVKVHPVEDDKKRKRSNETSGIHKEQKQKQPQPVLAEMGVPKFHDMYTVEPRFSAFDDPSLHSGMKRANPHIVGNWPSFVYLEWFLHQNQSEAISTLLLKLKSTFASGPWSGTASYRSDAIKPLFVDTLDHFATPRSLHISLSSTLNIKSEQRGDFDGRMRSALKAEPFLLRFTGVRWVSNQLGTRWFLVLTCQEDESLKKLLDGASSVADYYGQELLYQNSNEVKQEGQKSTDSKSAFAKVETGGSCVDQADESQEQSSLWVSVSDRSKRANRLLSKCREEGRDTLDALDDTGRQTSDISSPFHISIAWSLVPPASCIRSPMSIPEIKKIFDDDIANIHPIFDRVKFRVGDRVSTLPLGNDRVARRVIYEGQSIGLPPWNPDLNDTTTAVGRQKRNL